MAKPYRLLRERMSPERRARNERRTQEIQTQTTEKLSFVIYADRSCSAEFLNKCIEIKETLERRGHYVCLYRNWTAFLQWCRSPIPTYNPNAPDIAIIDWHKKDEMITGPVTFYI